MLFFAKNQTTARSAKSPVSCCRNVVSMRDRRWMQPGSNRPGDVRDVSEHPRADASRNLADAFEIDGARISRRATHEQLRLMLLGNSLQVVVIDLLSLF